MVIVDKNKMSVVSSFLLLLTYSGLWPDGALFRFVVLAYSRTL